MIIVVIDLKLQNTCKFDISTSDYIVIVMKFMP